ncbi:MAG: glycosyltransferase family A protein, partial [Bacteroidota bacterium]
MKAYLSKSALSPEFITEPPRTNLQMVVVLPCLAEPDLLQSLAALKACIQPPCSVEVLIIINHSEQAEEGLKVFNINTYKKANAWCTANSIPEFSFYPILAQNLPKKHAGVGLARKLGMDEACRRFLAAGQSDGLIVAFDADATCSPNFLSSIYSAFRQMPKQQAISISFEHP